MSEEKLIIDGLELIEKINNWRNKDFADSREYTDRAICDVLDSVIEMIYDTEPIQPQGIDKDRLIEELEEGYEQEVGKLKMISVDKAVQIINQQPTTDVPDTNAGEMSSHAQAIIDDLQERINKSHARYMELEYKCKKHFGYRLEEMLNKQLDQPTVEQVPLSEIYRVIAGHSDYHGDNILAALTCIAEGKEVKPVKPLSQPTTDGWISVSERLPVNTDNVLITTQYGVVLMAFIGISKNWCYIDGRRIDSQDTPVAWQPLPQPYKESE